MQNQKIAIVSKNTVVVSNCMISLKGMFYKYLYFSSLNELKESNLKEEVSLLIIDVSSNEDYLNFINKFNKFFMSNIEDTIAIVPDGRINKKLYFNTGISAGVEKTNIVSDLGLLVMGLIGEQTQIEEAVSKVKLPVDTSQLINISHRNVINKTLSFLQKNLHKVKNIDDLIMAIKESDSAINTAFLYAFNKTFSEFFRWYRIEKAKNILTKTNYPVKKIAATLGYSSAPNFSTAFKAQEGVTPTQYRRTHRSRKIDVNK
ncbi:helix-turn-helix domain-containing protein [Paenalcaligenes hominis]|uniref:helix-turn-helix domain-containing protein n=1 Tax=Paenalcaligenes hominis TaxID=643674 RepID=UPI0035268AA9